MKKYIVLQDDNRVLDLVSDETPDVNFAAQNVIAINDEQHLEIWQSGSNGDWIYENGQLIHDPVIVEVTQQVADSAQPTVQGAQTL